MPVTCLCGATLDLDPTMAGAEAFCPSCGRAVTAPPAAAPAGPTFAPPPAPRPQLRGKSSAGKVIALVVGTAAVLVLLCGGLFGLVLYKFQSAMHERKPLASSDGWTQITVPGHMSPGALASAEGDIKAGNPFSELYLLVLNEAKPDFPPGTSLENYKDLIVQMMSQKVQRFQAGPWEPVTINGNSALQAEVHGRTEGLDIAYQMTFVESDRGFHQILIWTLDSRFSQQRDIMREMADSFRTMD